MNSVDAAWRAVCLGAALILGAFSAWGGFEHTKKLEGGISYIVVASPFVVALVALIPPIGEWQWTRKQYFKSIAWWLVLLPGAWFVFAVATERFHASQAGAQAERAAYEKQANRAVSNLDTLKLEAKSAKEASDKTKGWKVCGKECIGIRATAERLATEVSDAEKALLGAEKLTTTASSVWLPPWLLGLTMDLMVFVCVWTGLSGLGSNEEQKVKRRYRRRRKPRPNNVTPMPLRVVK